MGPRLVCTHLHAPGLSRASRCSRGCRGGLRLPGTSWGSTRARVLSRRVSVCGGGRGEGGAGVSPAGLWRCPALLSSGSWATRVSLPRTPLSWWQVPAWHPARCGDRGAASPPSPRGASPLEHPPLPLAPGGAAGLMGGRLLVGMSEVMLPAALRLPRKPEFSFSVGMRRAEPRSPRSSPRSRCTPRAHPRSCRQSRSHPLCSSPFLPARKRFAFLYSVLSLRVCSPVPFLRRFCLERHRSAEVSGREHTGRGSGAAARTEPPGRGARWHRHPLLAPQISCGSA